MRRLAILATPVAVAERGPGALDGEALRARLPLEDTAFETIDVDPLRDFAEQLEDLFDKHHLGPDDETLVYVSCPVIASVDAELFVCLDPAQPTTGDSLRDLALVLRERFSGRAVFFLECRHAVDATDPFRSAAIVAIAKDMVRADETGIGLLVAARPLAPESEQSMSPLTRAFIGALDRADVDTGLTIEQFYEEVVDDLAGEVPGFAHVKGRGGFHLLARSQRSVFPPAEASGSTKAAEQEAEPAPKSSPAPRSEPPDTASPISSRRVSQPPMPLPENRSFQKAEPHLPKVIVSDRPAPPSARPAAAVPEDNAAMGARLARDGDAEGALAAYRRALGVLAPEAAAERAQVYLSIAEIKRGQEKRREAIASLEKALTLAPSNRAALEAVVELSVEEGDYRGAQVAEDRLLAALPEDKRFPRLAEFGARWLRLTIDDGRALALLELARKAKPDDRDVLEALQRLFERLGRIDDVLATRRTLALAAPTPRARAEGLSDLASYCLLELKREEMALELFDAALDADPSALDPLTIVARRLADRQEWAELEWAYRRMLDRAPRIESADVRASVTWELCRRLGMLYRDHLEDPGLALDAFEDAVEEKPDDTATRLLAVQLARSLGKYDHVVPHLQAIAWLEPGRHATFHELFEMFQKLRRPDQAFSASCVTTHLGEADERERFVYEEHKPEGLPAFVHPIRPEAWELLRVDDRDRNVEAVLEALAPAAIAARLAEGRLPPLDPATRQDPETSTASIVRSFKWASHFLGVAPPAIYVQDGAELALATVIAEEPSVVAGASALRGRSIAELAFLVGRHLSYHVGGHRLVLYYPSLEELSACFVAAVTIASPDAAMPPSIEGAAVDLRRRIEPLLSASEREDLIMAVRAFEEERRRANLATWVASVERSATRAGHLLSGDLDASIGVLRGDARGLVDVEAKVQDLLAFAVSDAHHLLRDELGVAVLP